MIRIKTLYLPLISALVASATLPAGAQLSLALSSNISYRQNKKDIYFTGGSFNTELLDGSATYVGGCEWYQYYPPGYYINFCSPGTTGLVSAGTIDGVDPAYPYLVISSIYPAFAVAPRHAEKIFLNAAPASTLPRPAGGFTDNSYSLFYNLTTTEIREYIITNYFKRTGYTAKQRDKFQSDIVPGVYYYSFPRLGDPNRPAPISAVIYPMLEGRQELNNTVQGFVYTKVNGNKWNKDGFVELSYLRPNSFNWTGMNPSTVFANADSLSFAIKVIQNPTNPNSDVVNTYAGNPMSIFPPYQNGGIPRVTLPSPYQTTFTTPPIFDSGTSGIAQVELTRNLKTGGVTYDFSRRLFQIPVVVVDRYTEYVDIDFRGLPAKGTDILDDPDKDGYNNLNEWILDSNGSNAASIPIAPRTELIAPVDPVFGLPTGFSYFGFNVQKKLGTIPKVTYTLQRSKDGGKTWAQFKTDPDWTVETIQSAAIANVPRRVEIQVRSKVYDDEFVPIQPPGTVDDIYRVKITLKQKK